MTSRLHDSSSGPDVILATAEQRLTEGDLKGCFEALKACLNQYPDHGPAVAAMGLFLAEHGEPGTAAQLLSRALTLNPDERPRIAPALARLLAGLAPSRWHPQLDADLCACLAEPAVEPQSLASAAAATLLLKQPQFDGNAETLEAMGRDPLWLAFLSRCLNVSAPMEARLDAVRAALVATPHAAGEARQTLICAMALSGFASEYVDDRPLDADATPGLLPALFRPLIVEEAATLGEGALEALLVRRTIEEPARERALAKDVPALTSDDADAVSAAVRAQYEANPYPRWTAPPAPTLRSLNDAVAALPRLESIAFGKGASAVLVAGCGAGFEPIDLARMDPSLNITALDLSRASLAQGVRIAETLGLSNIRFVQGDILALHRVKTQYDVVVSTGVLHHMAQPAAGLAQLAGVMRPGGVARLGLYSERARAVVRRAHDLIRRKGWKPVDADIRAFRAHVLALPNDDPLAALKESTDFYSLSGCRDLVFHIQEHRYTPPQLRELLAGAGLRLIGFDAPPNAMAAFRQAFGAADPLDLELWDRLEAQQPTLFAGMYHLWAQKPDQPLR